MADITSPAVIRYCNVYLRPFAERLRDLKSALEDATAEYASNVNGELSTHTAQDVVADGREGEGIGRVSKLNINRMRLMMEAVTVVLEDATLQDPDELLAVFTVRPLRIGG